MLYINHKKPKTERTFRSDDFYYLTSVLKKVIKSVMIWNICLYLIFLSFQFSSALPKLEIRADCLQHCNSFYFFTCLNEFSDVSFAICISYILLTCMHDLHVAFIGILMKPQKKNKKGNYYSCTRVGGPS